MDVVLYIEVTGSMYPIVDLMNEDALTFPKRLEE